MRWYKAIITKFIRAALAIPTATESETSAESSKTHYLKDLGVNAVWLSPIYDSPWTTWAMTSAIITMSIRITARSDFKEMLDEMHKRGIRLIMDGREPHIGRTLARQKRA